MGNVQVRLPQESIEEIDLLRNKLGSTRSEVIRRALSMGISHIKAELALKEYIENKITLCKAAQTSGMSISEFAEFASGKGIPFIRYPMEEAEKDLDKLRKIHASSP
ncbi:MAG TPA: ribbon-helix-helix protein, CopG family [Euryarchaeota archaeon]|nr:ribbon-helix-helix protein, CopG family [Euryarchaeota archaeon]